MSTTGLPAHRVIQNKIKNVRYKNVKRRKISYRFHTQKERHAHTYMYITVYECIHMYMHGMYTHALSLLQQL